MLPPNRSATSLARRLALASRPSSAGPSTRALGGARLVHQDVPTAPAPDPQVGDYPRLEAVNAQRKPALGWWDMQYRRNFGDTLHEQDEALNMFTPDVPHVAPTVALKQVSIVILGFVSLFTLINYVKPDAPMVRRTYPFDGLVKELGSLEANKARGESLEDDE